MAISGFSYDPGSGQPLDRVRELIGDTDPNARPLLVLVDAVILDAYDREGSVVAAALYCLRVLKARFAREADVGLKGAGLEATRRFERLAAIETQLLESLANSGGPSIAPVSQAHRDAMTADSDLIQPMVSVGAFDADG